jgi:hypothetical protein
MRNACGIRRRALCRFQDNTAGRLSDPPAIFLFAFSPILTRRRMAKDRPKAISSPPFARTTAFLNTVARIHLLHLFNDPFVAAAFKAAEDDGRAPASQRLHTEPGPIRALTIFDALPRSHRTLLIADDASAPHLKAGEYAVIRYGGPRTRAAGALRGKGVIHG